MKACGRCGEKKELDDFRFRSDGRYQSCCRACEAANAAERKRLQAEARGEKTCIACKKTRPISMFVLMPTGGYSRWCTSCNVLPRQQAEVVEAVDGSVLDRLLARVPGTPRLCW